MKAGSAPRTPPLLDGWGRRIHYLRLSVADRCNFRCVYCLGESAKGFAPASEVLSDDELVALAKEFAALGFTSIRVTGGEPLARHGIVGLVARLAALPGIEDLSMSTNGALLAGQARALKAAGLARVNISLDSLSETAFSEVTRRGRLEPVLEGVREALRAGLAPVKLNVVALRGVNDGEFRALAELSRAEPLHVRFIELMPMAETGLDQAARFIPQAEVMERIGPLEPLPRREWPRGSGPASYWRLPGGRGSVGFISALTCGFCEACNRVRLSADGTLYPCLDDLNGTDLRAPLRAGAGGEAVRVLIRRAVSYAKPERHHMAERREEGLAGERTMCLIGG